MSKAITAIYPGTFDPPTNGHLDVIARGAKIVDHLVVAILRNASKGTPLFTVNEREQMIREATTHIPNVTVETFDGLLVDFAREKGAKAVIRGIRAVSDYEYEFTDGHDESLHRPGLETLFMMRKKYTYGVSSRLIKGRIPVMSLRGCFLAGTAGRRRAAEEEERNGRGGSGSRIVVALIVLRWATETT